MPGSIHAPASPAKPIPTPQHTEYRQPGASTLKPDRRARCSPDARQVGLPTNGRARPRPCCPGASRMREARAPPALHRHTGPAKLGPAGTAQHGARGDFNARAEACSLQPRSSKQDAVVP